MTLRDVIRALVRRWPIVLIGLLITSGLAFASTRVAPEYHARTEMVFLAPPSERYPNELVTRTESLIITAGVVAKRINGAGERLKFGHSLVNPVGAPSNGEHTWINLLDIGTQWVPVFDDQILLLDSVGSTPEQARARIMSAAALVREELLLAQKEQGADELTYITARMSPEEPLIGEIRGSRPRAAGMTLVVGGITTVALVVILEVRSRSAGPLRGRPNRPQEELTG